MNTIHDRIKLLISKYANGNVSEFARMVDTSEPNIRNYTVSTTPKYDILNTIIEKLNLSAQWLMTGKGQMIFGSVVDAEDGVVSKPNLSTIINDDKMIKENDELRRRLSEKDEQIIELLRENNRLLKERFVLGEAISPQREMG